MDEVFANLSSGLKRDPAVSGANMFISKIKPCNRCRHYYDQDNEPWMFTLKGKIPKLKDFGVYSDLGVVVSCEGHEMVGYMTPKGRGDTSNEWKIRCCPPQELIQRIQLVQYHSKKKKPISAQVTVLDGLLPLKRAYVACHEIPRQCSRLPWFERTLHNSTNSSLSIALHTRAHTHTTDPSVHYATNQFTCVGCRSWP